LVLVSPALLVIVIAIVATLVFMFAGDPGTDPSAEAGLARIGDALALVIVTDDGGAATAEGTRDFVVIWGLVLPALALFPALGAAWLLAGRVLRIVRTANAEVARADEDRGKHLQEIVHELRTPLAVMGTNLELAAADLPQSDSADHIEAARRAVDRMARTVDDLDGHGRLALEENHDPVELADLTEAVAAEFVGPARSREVQVLLTGSSSIEVPSVDPAAVSTTIGNFLSNAVRLAPPGSAVTLDWGEVEDWAWVAVTDQGPGLPPHLHARVFERGWRGPYDRSRGNANGEAGLGLTIARQLTEAQGGAVTLESEEGDGATLTLWLPLDNAARIDAVLAADRVHPAIQPWRKDFQPA
jgi:signal transduction histidine kinase